ncbi:MAG TPA: AgmX/PglI C-terminal domain-containing protein [Myxococcales bacterium]|jgi:outer membrane biosynthesis protein TonB
MTSRTHQLLEAARSRPLTGAERSELDPRQAARLDPLALAEALAAGKQRLTPEEADRVFHGADPDREVTAVIDNPLALAAAIAGGAQHLSREEADRLCPTPAPTPAPAPAPAAAAPAADESTLQVVMLRGGTLAGSLVLPPGEYAVGSDANCELHLDDPAVGRCHAFLVFRDGKATLQAVSDDGALRINGVPQRTAEVRALDDVAIGPFVLKLRVVAPKKQRPAIPSPAPAAPPPPRAVAPQPRPQPLPQARPAAAAPRPQPQAAPAAPLTHPATPAARAAPPPAPPAPVALAQTAPPAPPAARAPAPVPASPAAAPASAPGRHAFRLQPMAGYVPPPPEDLGELPKGKDPGPVLRVRVFWGKTSVGVYGFEPGREVFAGPSDAADVAAYRLPLPSPRFLLAKSDKAGRWTLRVPQGLKAFTFEKNGWRLALGAAEKDATSVPLEPDKLVRLGDADYSLEVRVERLRRAPSMSLRSFLRSGVALPAAAVGALSVAAVLAVVFMPHYDESRQDFTPQQMLRAAKAVLKPPEKKKEVKRLEKLVEKPKEREKNEPKVDLPPDVPRSKNTQQVSQALKSVQRVTSGLAVESLLKATSKLTGGPKGYGDKGMGYKLSPLTGKPPVAMAGMSFGEGMGGFGTETKGIGAIRGMGGGGGGGIGSFNAGGTGKGKVGGTVVASAAGFKQRGGGGQLARELIAKVINEHMGEIRGCYERALLREAGLAGKLNLEWTIGTDGRVEEVKVKQATIKGSEVPNCIVGSLKTWIFPKPTGGKVIVSYPFLFNSIGF